MIFVVLLVLTVLSAIGIFAARTAGLNQRLSGYSRQATQTGYVAEYGTLAMVDELSTERKTIYLDEMAKGSDTNAERCRALEYVTGGVSVTCYRVYLSELQKRIGEEDPNAKFFDPNGGSLGPNATPLAGDFVIELTDRSLSGRPVAGMDQGGVGPRFRYDQVTLSATGQVRPQSTTDPNGGVCTTPSEQYAAQVAGSRSMRATVQVGPIPE